MKKKNLNILMLEDSDFDAELNQEQLFLLEEYHCDVTVIQTKEEYIEAIRATPPPDLILCDYNLPQYNGMQALDDLNELKLFIPFIFVTGAMQEEVAADAIKAGAWDYVVKDRLFRLPLAVRSVLNLRKEKETVIEAEKKSQRILQAIEETSAQIVILDKDSSIEYINKNFSETSGFSYDEIIGQDISLLYSLIDDSNKKLEIKDCLQQGHVYKGDVLTHKKNWDTYWEHLSITPIFDNQKNLNSYILVKEDVTQQKQIEQSLTQTIKDYSSLNQELKASLKHIEQINLDLEKAKQKAEESDKLKTSFLANLSHEIRTPMNGILGFADLLNDSDITEETKELYIGMIKKSGERMLGLIGDLVDISKIESGQVKINPEKADLNQIIDRLHSYYNLMARQKGISFICNKGLDESESNILIDSLKFEQVLTNLLNNAFKFTSKGKIELSYWKEKENLHFKVKDSGAGIPEGMEKLIFERFRQAENTYLKKTEGSGLGLSISKAFIELMGGRIWVKSIYGEGSEFYCTIPYKPISIPNANNIISQNSAYKLALTALVVEDDEIGYIYIQHILEQNNCISLHAENGQQAIEMIQQHPEISIILMDLKMPVMNGIEATKIIRQSNPTIPIIAQTAYTTNEDRKLALEAGCNDFITKPINKDILLKKLKTMLD